MSKFKFTWVPVTLLLLLGSAMVGLTDYLAGGMDASIISSEAFWLNLITTNIGTLSLIIAILLVEVDKFCASDPTYIFINDAIEEHYRTKYKAVLFKKYAAICNYDRKRNTYIKKINKKISKLKASPEDLRILYKGTEEEKDSNSYIKKIRHYEHLTSEEYLKAALDKIDIKYTTISESLVYSGVKTSSNKEEYITTVKTLKIAKDFAPKYTLTFAMSLILASFTMTFKDGLDISVVFKTVVKLFIIIQQLSFAKSYSKKYNIEVTLHDLKYRYGIITSYELWCTTMSQKGDTNNGQQ